MNVICQPAQLQGDIAAIPSKSDAHRRLICAALAEHSSMIQIAPPFCADLEATMRCLRALGAEFQQTTRGCMMVQPIRTRHLQHCGLLDCGESGSTFRFLLPVAAALCAQVAFTGSGRLPQRPISTLANAMQTHGVCFSGQTLPFSTTGRLRGGAYEIAGDVSSQFLTGLLLALPLCEEDSTICLTTALQSLPYVTLTRKVLYDFGIIIPEHCENGRLHYSILGNQKFHAPTEIAIDGDWSNAAFWLAANALGSEITISGLRADSIQGDRAIVDVLQQYAATPETVTIDMQDIPDLLPILAVRAAFAACDTHFTHAERLRYKESDRLTATAALLTALGGTVEEHPDGLIVHGGGLQGGTVDAQNDHRLAMAAAIAATRCTSPVTILGAEAVRKSYPHFFADYQMLGGICDGIDIR